MDKLRVGVIGLGIGRKHINGFREHDGALVTASIVFGKFTGSFNICGR